MFTDSYCDLEALKMSKTHFNIDFYHLSLSENMNQHKISQKNQISIVLYICYFILNYIYLLFH